MADKAHRWTEEKLLEMERELLDIYKRAHKEMGVSWKEYLKEIDKEISSLQKSYDDLKKGGNKEEIRKAGKELQQAKKERTIMDKRFKAVSETLATELLHVNETAMAYINDQIPEIYSVNYNQLSEVIKESKIKGYTFALTDAYTVKHLASSDKSLLPYKLLDPDVDFAWNMKAINREVLQGILQGESIPKIAKRLLNVENMNVNQAVRSARTIVTGAENKGRLDSYYEAEKNGVIIQKEWLSSDQPGRTRDWHMPEAFESLVVDIDKPFVNAIGKIMFPGDPEADGANVYNCRCTMGAVIKGFKKVKK